MGNDILCFFLADNPAYWTQVEQIRQKTGLGVRVIPRTESALQSAYPLAKGVTPAQWLSLIAGASMVLTDSFHAAAFSLLLHTPCTIPRRYREDDPESRNRRPHTSGFFRGGRAAFHPAAAGFGLPAIRHQSSSVASDSGKGEVSDSQSPVIG